MTSVQSKIVAILILFVYNIVLFIFTPFAVCFIIWNLVITDKSRRGMGQRLGFVSVRRRADAPRIWSHAVSVGENVAVEPIWESLLAALPGWELIHSTTTDTGQAQAEKLIKARGKLIYFPFDFLPCVLLALYRAHPRLIVLVETEVWPNFLAVAKLMGCKVLIVNGRISDRSLLGGARLGMIYRWMTSNVDRYCMQSTEDAERIIQLGADPSRIVVVGNSKFDQTAPEVSLGEQITLRNALGLQRDEPLLLAGSTHAGEEEIVLRAFRQVKASCANVRLLIAPRDVNRAQEIEELVTAHGFSATRRTRLATMPSPPDAVIILDTIGELGRAYALCTSAFVGGSLGLVPVGGHNVLEPLALGKPTLFGPDMGNSRETVAFVQQAGVGVQVDDADAIAAVWRRFLNDPTLCRTLAEKAIAVCQQHRGASQRCALEAARLVEGENDPALGVVGK